MTNREHFYELSTKANTVFIDSKNLLGLHLLRYKHLVDHSEKGFDCTYAEMTRRHFSNLAQEELITLQALRRKLDLLIEEVTRETENR